MTRKSCRSLCLHLRNLVYSIVLTSVIIIYLHVWLDKYNILKDLSPTALEYIHYKKAPGQNMNSTKVRYFINKYNQGETILNVDKFGHLKGNTIVIVIQVHKYRETFKYLLASLSETIGIQDVLLIFSHSYVDDNVNKLIQSIDFCRVLQIFYPYSLQAYPHEFPGNDKDDEDVGNKKSEPLNCTAFTPGGHRQYRHPPKAEKKHSWWWTANKVFQNLSCTEGITGAVIFLEEDLYIMQDFLYMFYFMRNVAKSFPQCEMISFRTEPSPIIYDDVYRVEVSTWDPRHHSSVVALDVSAWKTIVARYDIFCSVDDSSWYTSLLHLSFNRNGNEMFKVVYSTIPRAIKTSYCLHGVLGSCNILENVLQALIVQQRIKKDLFPPYLEVYTHIELEHEEFLVFDVVDGGWNDPRDVELCRNITSNKVIKLLSDMEQQFQDYIII